MTDDVDYEDFPAATTVVPSSTRNTSEQLAPLVGPGLTESDETASTENTEQSFTAPHPNSSMPDNVAGPARDDLSHHNIYLMNISEAFSNQISATLNMETAEEHAPQGNKVTSLPTVLHNEDAVSQAQLEALLKAHEVALVPTEAAVDTDDEDSEELTELLPVSVTESSTSTTLSSTAQPSTKRRKRPRPKPYRRTTPKKAISVTNSPALFSTTTQQSAEISTSQLPTTMITTPTSSTTLPTTLSPSTEHTTLATMSTTSSPTAITTSAISTSLKTHVHASKHPVTKSTTTPSASYDNAADVLQFLVSNPPAWVLDEIMNGTKLTTWYPLPMEDGIIE